MDYTSLAGKAIKEDRQVMMRSPPGVGFVLVTADTGVPADIRR